MGGVLDTTWVLCGTEHRTGRLAPATPAKETRERYEFLWIRQGKAICRVAGKPCAVAPGDMLLLRPGQAVQWRSGPSSQPVIYAFAFGLSGLGDSLPRPQAWPLKRRMPDHDILRPLFEYVVTHTGASADPLPPAVGLAVQTMMIAFVGGRIDRPQVTSYLYPGPLQRVMQWMRDFMGSSNPGLKVTLEDLADVGGVSAKHLCRLFRQHVGCGPMALLYALRVTRSLIGLEEGKEIESLAYDLGFSSASHYTRRFTALFRRSPGNMQKALARGYRPKLPKLPLMS